VNAELKFAIYHRAANLPQEMYPILSIIGMYLLSALNNYWHTYIQKV